MLFEFTEKKKQELISKFKAENPELGNEEVKQLVNDWESLGAGRNIDQYSFTQARDLMDEIIIRQELRGKGKGRFFKSNLEPPEPIYSKNNLEIFIGDTKKKCQYLSHKHVGSYEWCIGRINGSNLFNMYQNRKPVFYFVFDHDRKSGKDEYYQPIDTWHAIVIIVYPDYIAVATADNPGDKTMSWDQIVKKQPKLSGLEDIFAFKKLKSHSIHTTRTPMYSHDMSFIEKFNYIDNGHLIDKKDLDILLEDEPLLFDLYAKRNPLYFFKFKDLMTKLKSSTARYVIHQLKNIITNALDQSPVAINEIIGLIKICQRPISDIDQELYNKTNAIFYMYVRTGDYRNNAYFDETADKIDETVLKHIHPSIKKLYAEQDVYSTYWNKPIFNILNQDVQHRIQNEVKETLIHITHEVQKNILEYMHDIFEYIKSSKDYFLDNEPAKIRSLVFTIITSNIIAALQYSLTINIPWRNIDPDISDKIDYDIFMLSSTNNAYYANLYIEQHSENKFWREITNNTLVIEKDEEQNIAPHSKKAYEYAKLLNEPWSQINPAIAEKAEETIKKDNALWQEYCRLFCESHAQKDVAVH